jgi:hypothetical protein
MESKQVLERLKIYEYTYFSKQGDADKTLPW